MVSDKRDKEIKTQIGIKKRILKSIAYECISKEFLDRPKMGVSVPLNTWLRKPLKNQLLDFTDSEF